MTNAIHTGIVFHFDGQFTCRECPHDSQHALATLTWTTSKKGGGFATHQLRLCMKHLVLKLERMPRRVMASLLVTTMMQEQLRIAAVLSKEIK